MEIKKKYLCECGNIQTRKEMRNEYNFGYDQLCCTKCGDVLIDNLHGVVHCTTINNNGIEGSLKKHYSKDINKKFECIIIDEELDPIKCIFGDNIIGIDTTNYNYLRLTKQNLLYLLKKLT